MALLKDIPGNFSKQVFSIVCRGSLLSLGQAALFKQKVNNKFPDVTINIIIKETAGDKDQSTPLHLVEGKDFFTQDIQDFLQTGHADFAVHSMKDVSDEDFFKQNHYAVIDRNDLRDVAIFNNDIIDKLKAGKKIIIGTSSPRRTNMAAAFLQKGLPQFNGSQPQIEAIPIRGNVEIRLQKLHLNDSYDGIILAAAGLNRLMEFEDSVTVVKQLLKDKKIMVLPLFECPPAAGQGAIVAETQIDNHAAIHILQAVKDEQAHTAIKQERVIASKYGYGLSQEFGTFHVDTDSISFTYAGGKGLNHTEFTEWDFSAKTTVIKGAIFSSTDYMKDFFTYHYLENVKISESVEAVYIASHKAIFSEDLKNQIAEKRVWAAGTRTWVELAKKGIWVEGSADGLGFQFIKETINSPLININASSMLIITNTASAVHWLQDGNPALGTYELIPALTPSIKGNLAAADYIFWTSFQQYKQCKNLLKPTSKHFCLPGKTATLLKKEGIDPILFPGIKAFIEWKQQTTIATAEG